MPAHQRRLTRAGEPGALQRLAPAEREPMSPAGSTQVGTLAAQGRKRARAAIALSACRCSPARNGMPGGTGPSQPRRPWPWIDLAEADRGRSSRAAAQAAWPRDRLRRWKGHMLRIASDVGGTFTDSIAYDPVNRRLSVAKVSTTPQAREIGTIDSLRRTLQQLGATGSAVAYIGHGMTTATNAVIQRRGAKTAFVTNHGFTDLLLIGRQDRPSLYDVEVVRAPPLVPRELCYGILGRLDAGGREVEPLSHADLERAAADMRRHGVEAVA